VILKQLAISAVIATGLAAAPVSNAEAHRHFCGPLCWPFAAAAAVVGTAAVIATAPIRALAPPYGYYAPPPAAAYYPPPAPAYYAPSYYGYPYYR
jgi:hypothetical protein